VFEPKRSRAAEAHPSSYLMGTAGKGVGARFSAAVQTGPGHPASYTMDTGSFPVVKWPGRGFDHPPHLRPGLKKE